tara:strand:- start:651 stop:1184 length:534 start_codon:yes stop_codon:yes gene_type:complete
MMTKINLFKKLGNSLLEQGRLFLVKAFKVKLKEVTGQYIANLILANTGIAQSKVWKADRTYFYTDLKTIKDILKYDLVDKRLYEAEKFDCDDFAEIVHARFRSIYGINTIALARYIKSVDSKTGKHLFWHRANIFIAEDNNELKVFYLEPQTDYIVELTGKYTVIGNRRYLLNTIDF